MGGALVKKIGLLLVWMAAVVAVYAQTPRIDSLKMEIARTADPGARTALLLTLCSERNSLNPDTLAKYATEARGLALQRKDPIRTSLAEYYIAFNLMTRGLLDSSLKIAERELSR